MPSWKAGNPAPWVFASAAATPLDYAGVARRFRAILVRAKLPNHSPYDLRHTTTLRHYAH